MRVGRWALLSITMMLGCANDNVSVYVQNAVVPEASGDGCEVSVDGAVLLRGFVDTALGGDYGVAIVFRNGLFRRPGPVSADPNGVFVTEVIITVEDLAGNAIALSGPNPFTTQISAFVPAGDPDTPGASIAYLPLLPLSYVQDLAGIATTLVFTVEFRGHTQGGTEVEFGPWQWVADTCSRCLVACDTAGTSLPPGLVFPCPIENILQITDQCI